MPLVLALMPLEMLPQTIWFSQTSALCSGQIALDPTTMEIVGEDAKTQTQQVMENLGEVLSAAGSDFSKVIKCSVFLNSMDDFDVVNEIYGIFFTENPPARETVAVQTLPKHVFVEISCIASV